METLEELTKAFPFLNYVVPMIVALVFAQREVKKRHERHDRQRTEDLAYRAAHEVADMAHRKAAVDAMDALTKTVKDLGDAMNRHMEKTDVRFEQMQRDLHATQQENNTKFSGLAERLLFMEGQLQGIPIMQLDEMRRLAKNVADESIGKIPDLTVQKPKIQTNETKQSTEDKNG